MPFKGNPNAGAPDPALAQLLFARQDARRKAEREQQQDTLAAAAMVDKQRQDAEKFRNAERRADAADARAEREHQITLQKASDEAGGRVAEAQRNAAGKPNLSQTDLSIEGGSPQESARFSEEIMGLLNVDQAGIESGRQAHQLLEDRVRSAASLRAGQGETDPFAARQSVLGAASSFTGEEGRQRDIARDVKIEDEGRANRERRRAATISNDRSVLAAEVSNKNAVSRDTNITKFREKELRSLARTFNSKDSSQEERELAFEQHKSIVADRNADRLRSIPDEHIKQKNKAVSMLQDYLPKQRNVEMLKQVHDFARQNVNSVGTAGFMNSFISNTVDVIETATGQPFEVFFNNSINTALANPNNTEAERIAIAEFAGDEAMLQRISSGRLAETEAAWALNHMFNPSGRVNQKQLENINKGVRFTGFFVGPKLAVANIRSTIGRMSKGLKDQRDLINLVDKTILFDLENGQWIRNQEFPASDFDEFDSNIPFSTTSGAGQGSGEIPKGEMERITDPNLFRNAADPDLVGGEADEQIFVPE